ncbi:hypothetical protein TNCV_2568601 [Trichonephila clavipes]|uniref:Uncharacterized protein n=1 Tax=Trichonephila clavipes TaxID=2585209 RepID=A0A8X6WKM6_TRICX|nr:hypothetical protein TNCV_2568601 [Trichonephila clavipes]
MDKWIIRTPSTSSANKRTNIDVEFQNSELNAPSKKLRKYNEEFIKYGFTICVVDDEKAKKTTMTTTGKRVPTLSNRSQDFENAMNRNLEGNRCSRLSGFQMLHDDEIVIFVQA